MKKIKWLESSWYTRYSSLSGLSTKPFCHCFTGGQKPLIFIYHAQCYYSNAATLHADKSKIILFAEGPLTAPLRVIIVKTENFVKTSEAISREHLLYFQARLPRVCSYIGMPFSIAPGIQCTISHC